MVPCIKYAWPIEIFKIGPPYGLLSAHGLMFSSQEVLCSFHSLRMHNSIPKSIPKVLATFFEKKSEAGFLLSLSRLLVSVVD